MPSSSRWHRGVLARLLRAHRPTASLCGCSETQDDSRRPVGPQQHVRFQLPTSDRNVVSLLLRRIAQQGCSGQCKVLLHEVPLDGSSAYIAQLLASQRRSACSVSKLARPLALLSCSRKNLNRSTHWAFVLPGTCDMASQQGQRPEDTKGVSQGDMSVALDATWIVAWDLWDLQRL